MSAAIAAEHPLVDAGRDRQCMVGVVAFRDRAIECRPAETQEGQGRQETHAPSEFAVGLVRIGHRVSSGVLEFCSLTFVCRNARRVPRLDPGDRISSVRRAILAVV